MKTKRKSRDDVEAMGDYAYEPHVPRNKFDYDKIDGALKPLDALARSLEIKWGVGKLEQLVSPETGAKFKSAQSRMNEAIQYTNVDETLRRINVVMRGWEVMEKEARSRGSVPLDPDAWTASVEAEGGKPAVEYIIVTDAADATKAKKKGVPVYNLTEVARMIRFFNGTTFEVDKVKSLFPDAEIKNIRLVDDDLPF